MNKILLRRRRKPINLISLEISTDMEANIAFMEKMKEEMMRASGIPSHFINGHCNVDSSDGRLHVSTRIY